MTAAPATAQLGFEHVHVPGASGWTLLLLHGTGGDEHQLVELGRRLAPQASLLSPRGKVLEQGVAPRFFARRSVMELDLDDLRIAPTSWRSSFVWRRPPMSSIRLASSFSATRTAPTSRSACSSASLSSCAEPYSCGRPFPSSPRLGSRSPVPACSSRRARATRTFRTSRPSVSSKCCEQRARTSRST